MINEFRQCVKHRDVDLMKMNFHSRSDIVDEAAQASEI